MVIAIINYKGGVGKTTSAVNIGAGLRKSGASVLLIDTDPQANLTTSVGLTTHERITLYNVLKEELPIENAIVKDERVSSGVHIIPASEKLSRLHTELAEELNKESLLRIHLESLRNAYDFILIDCSPTRNLLNDNALVAADEAYIPVQTQHLAAQGLGLMQKRVEEIQRRRLNEHLRISGIIATMHVKQSSASQGVEEGLREVWSNTVFKTVIRQNVALHEAPALGQDIFTYAPKSNGAKDYEALCAEILERAGLDKKPNGRKKETIKKTSA